MTQEDCDQLGVGRSALGTPQLQSAEWSLWEVGTERDDEVDVANAMRVN